MRQEPDYEKSLSNLIYKGTISMPLSTILDLKAYGYVEQDILNELEKLYQ